MFKTSIELIVSMMHFLGFEQWLLVQRCCGASCNETVAKAWRRCREAVCEALTLPSRRRYEAAARLLRKHTKVTTVLLRSYCGAVENVAKLVWRYHEVARIIDAVAMLLRSRYTVFGIEAVPMRR